jgi:hypothetical protein
VWGVILEYLHIYDTILLRAASTWLFELCKEIRPFPKYFVLDQDKYVEYLVESGSISGLEYVKKTLRFEWPPNLCCVAARSGHVDMLKHLRKQGLQFDINTILMDCARGTCDIAMVKYLHENGVPWMQYDISNLSQPQTVIDLMAYTGHIECMTYALGNGCVDYHVNYVPSVECWEFAKKNGLIFPEKQQAWGIAAGRIICEQAAILGNLTILKHAHQNEADLGNSAAFAAKHGHLLCLEYALEHYTDRNMVPDAFKTIECFNSVLKKLGWAELWSEVVWTNQLRIGNIEILRVLLEHKEQFPLPEARESFISGLRSTEGNTAGMMKFLLDDVKFPSLGWENPYTLCASRGDVEGLKFAFERNLPGNDRATNRALLPISHSVMIDALTSKNLDLVKFAWEKYGKNEDLIFDRCQKFAAASSTPEILDFLRQQGAEWDSSHLTFAIKSNNLPNLAYLTRIGCE